MYLVCTSIFCFAENNYLEDNKYFSINIPNNYDIEKAEPTFKEIANYIITHPDKKTNIQISVYKKQEGFSLNENETNEYTQGLANNLREKYNMDNINPKGKTTTLGKEHYNCTHIILPNINGIIQEQYISPSDNYMYLITITTDEQNKLQELSNIISSFKINDTITEDKSASNSVYDFIYTILKISGFIFDILIAIAVYMTVPLIIFFTKRNVYTKKQILRMVIVNSIVGFIILLMMIFVLGGTPNAKAPFFYGFINYYLLKKYAKNDIAISK